MKQKSRTTRTVKTILIYFAVIGGGILYLFPIIWSVLASFKHMVDTFCIPPRFIFSPTLNNYISVIQTKHFFSHMLNSIVVCSFSTLIALLLGSLAAYSLSRCRIPAKENIAFWILSLRMGPPIAFIIPFYILFQKAGLVDSYWVLIIMYTFMNLPFSVWMMRSFIEGIPVSIEESAMIDGCSRLSVFLRITLPLSKPGLCATAFFSLIFAWNEFLYALILTYKNVVTVPVKAASLVAYRGILWNELGAVSVLSILPIVLFTFFIRRHLVSGLTFGAIR